MEINQNIINKQENFTLSTAQDRQIIRKNGMFYIQSLAPWMKRNFLTLTDSVMKKGSKTLHDKQEKIGDKGSPCLRPLFPRKMLRGTKKPPT